MDPVFGRGYCEETDWSLRSMAAGYRVALAPGTFVYHAGRGSNLEAGLVSASTPRCPRTRTSSTCATRSSAARCGRSRRSGILAQARLHGVAAFMRRAGAEVGYTIDAGWLPPSQADEELVRCTSPPTAWAARSSMEYLGFHARHRRHRRVRDRRVAQGVLRRTRPVRGQPARPRRPGHLAPVGVRGADPPARELPVACLTPRTASTSVPRRTEVTVEGVRRPRRRHCRRTRRATGAAGVRPPRHHARPGCPASRRCAASPP